MAKLKATRTILHQNRLYEAGEELPQHDAPLVKAWLAAGSARMEKGTGTTKAAKPKAETTSGKAKTAADTKATAKKGQK